MVARSTSWWGAKWVRWLANGRLERWARRLGLLLALGSIAWVGWVLTREARELAASAAPVVLLRRVPIGALGYALLLVLRTGAWWWLCGVDGRRPRPIGAASVWTRTQIAKYLPGNVFHYFSRQMLGRHIGLSHPGLIASTLLEEVSLLQAALAIAIVGGLTTGTKLGLGISVPLLAAAVVVSPAALSALDAVLRRLPWVGPRMRPLPPLAISRALGLLSPAILIQTLALVLAGALLVFLQVASWPDAELSWLRLIWVFALACAAGMVVPGAPAGLGVREAVLVLQLGPFLGAAEAGALAVAMRLVTVGGELLAAAVGWLLRPAKDSPSDN